MKLRELLVHLDKIEWVSVVYHGLSDGAYTVEEWLENNNELLEKNIRPGCIETRIERADEVISYYSKERENELFKVMQGSDIIYIIVELQD